MRLALEIDRRRFLRGVSALGAGLSLGVAWEGCDPGMLETPTIPLVALGPWIRVAPDDVVTIFISRSELGQGIATSAAMLVAEELEVDWATVRTEWTSADPIYGHQRTAASASLKTLWKPLREAGAVARELLVAAAAEIWGVEPSACRAEESRVHHADGRVLAYGELATVAATLPLPRQVRLKTSGEFRLIGRSQPRLDIPAKVDGSAVFGWDVRVPGMLTAVVERCPVVGGTLADYDASAALAVDGVAAVVPIKPYFLREDPQQAPFFALGIVAKDFWTAQLGRQVLEARWHDQSRANFDDAGLRRMFRDWIEERPGESLIDRGSLEAGRQRSVRELRAVYEAPFLAHATMAPMSCTAQVRPDRCDLWLATQAPELAQRAAEVLCGLPSVAVHIHKTYVGGGFGRRVRADFVAEAVQLSQAVGQPVQVLWTRDDDMRHGVYRPASYHVLGAGLDIAGRPSWWRHQIAGVGSRTHLAKGVDNVPYAMANKQVGLVRQEEKRPPVPTGLWRSVSNSQNAFVVESFLDELAAAAGRDPYLYRRELLDEAPRYRAVLDLAAEQAGWDTPAASGTHRGIALHDTEGGIVAEVAEVSIVDAKVRVHRIVCAVDCGLVVHPDNVVGQIEGAVIFGLSAALHGAINFEGGKVQQGNFDDYPILRIDETPEIEVHLIEGRESIVGAGECGLPPVAPAVVNAIYAATDQRLRRLPIRLG